MDRSKRLALYLASFVVVVTAYVYAYRWGMATYEGEQRTYLESFGIVVQSLTTTGYGQDAPWESTFMQALVILIQTTGIAYIFVAFPLFVVPWIKRMVGPSTPESIEDLDDHVVVLGYTTLLESLIDELDARGRKYVVVHEDEEAAVEMRQTGRRVLYGDSTASETLDEVSLSTATAVIVDATAGGIGTVLAVRDRDDDVTIACLIDEPATARYLRYAGADEVLSPRHRLGKSLADKVRAVVRPMDGLEFGDGLSIAEFPADPEGPLVGTTLRSWRNAEETGATLLGGWVRGDFIPVGEADAHLDESSSLLFAGGEKQLDRVAESIGIERRGYDPTREPVVVVGSGTIGRTAIGSLGRAGIETSVVDVSDDEYVDVVGDATNETVLNEVGIKDAGTLIITVSDGDTAIRTTLVAHAIAPDIEIIVAAPDQATASKCYSAGADYVLTLSQVAGRMVVLTLFEHGAMRLGERLSILRTSGAEAVGRTIGELRRSNEAVPTIVAVEREEEIIDPADELELLSGDHLFVAGGEDDLREFEGWIDERTNEK